VDKANFIHWLFDYFGVSDNEYDYKFAEYFKNVKNDLDFSSLKAFYSQYETEKLPSWLHINNVSIERINVESVEEKFKALNHIRRIEKEKRSSFAEMDENIKNKIREFCSKNGIIPIFDKQV
jgi:hypothetical protein